MARGARHERLRAKGEPMIRECTLVCLVAFVVGACGAKESDGSAAEPAAADTEASAEAGAAAMARAAVDEIELSEGSGEAVQAGQTAVVHYTGWLYDVGAPDNQGKKFDSSLDRNEPFAFRLGAGEVIAGWDQGVAGMQVGGKRRLIIPPELGYGERGAGADIPPGATLVFDIELVEIR